MNKIKVIGLFPLKGHGGIASWANKFMSLFPNDEFHVVGVDVSGSSNYDSKSKLYRTYDGLKALFRIKSELKKIILNDSIKILHTTTSGSLGTFRDYQVAKLCKKYNVKTILHCRYGCIPQDISANGFGARFLKKTFELFDQIWVLDRATYDRLSEIDSLKDKVLLTPNSIDISDPIDADPKNYTRMAFVGNLLPTKGIYELVEAATKSDLTLDIIGAGTEERVNAIKQIAGDKLNKTVFLHGLMKNEDAVEKMKNVDIVALPTYYHYEAFPMSILEAMSKSKLIISCPRAAIPDMLTDIDGKPCGILVEPQSVDGIVNAIEWCQQNPKKADALRMKAYEKVYSSYRTDVVYELYRSNYRKLLASK